MREKILFIIIIFLGLVLRLWRINIPLLEFVPSRQIQTAEITENLPKSNFNFLYPEVNYYGTDNSKYFLVEFPAYNLVVSAVDKAIGVKEINGRIVSVFFFVIASVFLYFLVKELVGRKIAFASLFFFVTSPLNILTSRSFLPEEMMIASSIAVLYYLHLWTKSKNQFYLLVSLLLFTLALILKITSFLFLILPIIYLLQKGIKTHKLLSAFTFIFVPLVPSLLWLYHAAVTSRLLNTELASAFNLSNWFGLNVFFDPKYYSNIFGIEYNLVLLPTGMFLFLIGIFATFNLKRSKLILFLWLLSCAVYFFIFNKHTMTHEYYHLPFLPIGSIFAGIGIVKIIDGLKGNYFAKSVLVVLIFLMLFVFSLLGATSRAYMPIERFNSVVALGKRVQFLTSEDDLIIGIMDSGPAVVHYSKRRGWGLEIEDEKALEHRKFYGINSTYVGPIEKVNLLRNKGAVILAAGYKKQLDQNSSFKNYLYGTFTVMEETDATVIFDLKNQKNN